MEWDTLVKIIEMESRVVVARAWERGMWSHCLIGLEFQIDRMKRIMEVGTGDGCEALWMCLIAMNLSLKNSEDGVFYVFYTYLSQ